jgi:hypothetical protein
MEKVLTDRERNRPHDDCGLLLQVSYYLQFRWIIIVPGRKGEQINEEGNCTREEGYAM